MDEYSILKKKRKKNGFAATSLLISIALALLVLVGAVLILGKVDNEKLNAVNDDTAMTLGNNCSNCVCLTKEMIFNNNIRDIKEAAVSYYTNERLPQTVGETYKITLKEMLEQKLVNNIIDGSNKQCNKDKSYVEVTKENNEYVMKVFLSCSDIEDYIIVHLGCYDYCNRNTCKTETPKVFEYEYKKTISCTMSDWSSWGAWKLTRESTSDLKKEDTKTETSTNVITETIDATKNPTTYNCNKYAGYTLVGDKCVKETTTKDVKDATPSKYSYNCDKYPGYSVVGTKCVKETTTTDTKDATKNPTTYNCDKYPGYKLDGNKCVKKTTTTDTIDATVTYNCDKYDGYKVDGSKCVKTTSTTDTKDATVTYNCDKYDGYELSGTKCVKTTKITDKKDATVTYNCDKYDGYKVSGNKCIKDITIIKDAEPVYSTRTKNEDYTCYKKECTTKIVFTCPDGQGCGDYPETSCESVKKTCTKEVTEKYISGYKCPNDTYKLQTKDGKKVCVKTTTDTKSATSVYDCKKYSGYTLSGKVCKKTTTTTDKKDTTKVYDCKKYDGYTLSGSSCKKTTTTTDTKDATKVYDCKKYDGYTLDGKVCKKTTTTTDKKDATTNPTTYNCDKYAGYTLDGSKCKKTTTTKDTKEATKVSGGYVCQEGYTLDGKTCTKVTKTTDTKKADSSKESYTCPEGYSINGTKCTKKVNKEVKTTYYRYATRTCDGGSVSIKWSTSQNDSILKSDGYKLTGAKKEIIVK